MVQLQDRHLFTGVVDSAKLPVMSQIIGEQSKQVGVILTSFPKDIDSYIKKLNTLSSLEVSNKHSTFLGFPESPPNGIDRSVKQARNARRLSTLLQLKELKEDKICIVTTPEALFGNVPSLETFVDNTCMLKVGNRYDYRDLVKK